MTKIFADTASVSLIQDLLTAGIPLDGVTTNPSLFKKEFEGKKFSEMDLDLKYVELLREIRKIIPQGSISGEIYADEITKAEEILRQAREMSEKVENLHIKIPITSEGLKAAEIFVNEGGKVNMTLCFSQNQAMAVEMATMGASTEGQVYVSPFVGRLNDIGIRGMSLIENIQKMFLEKKAHTKLLAASVRTMDQFQECLKKGVDIVTVPAEILMAWKKIDCKIFSDLPYESEIAPSDLGHELTQKGIELFVQARKDLLL